MVKVKTKINKNKKKSTSLRLDPAMLKALKLHAVETETSIQSIVEKLIADYLQDINKLKNG